MSICNIFNKKGIWINLHADVCINGISYKTERDINPRSITFNTIRRTKPSKHDCPVNCGDIWTNTGVTECVNCVNRVQQTDGCGNLRWIVVQSGVCNSTPNWIETTDFICFQAESHVIEKDINPCSTSYNQLRIGKISGNACEVVCVPNWTNFEPYTERCNDSVSEIYQFDGCGNFRWVEGGEACESPCVSNWTDTGQTRCRENINEKEQSDGCGNTRWVAGGNACGQVQLYPLLNIFTSFYSYDISNNATLNISYPSIQSLWNNINTEYSNVSNVLEDIKSDNSGGAVIGAKLYNSTGVSYTVSGYFGYIESNTLKYIQLVAGTVVLKDVVIPTSTTVTNTRILFPFYSYNSSSSSDEGYGYPSYSLNSYETYNETGNTFNNYWKSKLEIASDGLTITDTSWNYISQGVGSPAGFTIDWVINGTSGTFSLRKYWMINRGEKHYTPLTSYKLPDIYRGSTIEVVISTEPYGSNPFPIGDGEVDSINATYTIQVGI